MLMLDVEDFIEKNLVVREGHDLLANEVFAKYKKEKGVFPVRNSFSVRLRNLLGDKVKTKVVFIRGMGHFRAYQNIDWKTK